MRLSRIIPFALACTLCLGLVGQTTASASREAQARTFRNCTALNAVYPHGVGRRGAVDRVRGSARPVTNFTRNNRVYNANSSRDRDGDRVACEKR